MTVGRWFFSGTFVNFSSILQFVFGNFFVLIYDMPIQIVSVGIPEVTNGTFERFFLLMFQFFDWRFLFGYLVNFNNIPQFVLGDFFVLVFDMLDAIAFVGKPNVTNGTFERSFQLLVLELFF